MRSGHEGRLVGGAWPFAQWGAVGMEPGEGGGGQVEEADAEGGEDWGDVEDGVVPVVVEEKAARVSKCE